MHTQRLFGVDFSSAPSKRKPIWVAEGEAALSGVRLQALTPLTDWTGFEAWLRRPGPWLAGLDLPLGLPRAFVDAQGWGPTLPDLAHALRQRGRRTRREWQALIDTWGNARPAGQRLIHRRCDTALPGGARSTSPLQTRYVPVGFMLFEGLPRVLDAGVTLVGQHAADPARLALEAYPGWLAQQAIGRRSYKNTDDAERRAARADLLAALRRDGGGLGLALDWPEDLHALMLDDPSGDPMDAAMCLLQAAWAAGRPGWGLPEDLDPLEGWIVGAQ
jgi:hypothetical protein